MGRPQTIFVNPDELLANVCRLWNATAGELDRDVADGERRALAADQAAQAAEVAFNAERFNMAVHEKRMAAIRYRREEHDYLAGRKNAREALDRDGLPYDILAFAGKSLSPSERLRVNQALRDLERQGLVEITSPRATRIWPTPEGLAKARELAPSTPQEARNDA
jgi:hypothetical protein